MLNDYPCHFVSFYSQSMIEFTVTLHNAVARNLYLTVHDKNETIFFIVFCFSLIVILNEYFNFSDSNIFGGF